MAANKKTQALIASEQYQKIRLDLLEQLERNGTIGEYYVDLVNDYMDMWVTKSLLVEDIQRRGITVPYNNGGNQKGRKRNECIEARIKVNIQMLKLLTEIGIKPTDRAGDGDETEDM